MNPSRNNVLETLGYLIRQHRVAIGISQEELGLRSNLDRTYISGLERGVRNPSVTALVKVAKGLGISVSDLLDGLEEGTAKRIGNDKSLRSSKS